MPSKQFIRDYRSVSLAVSIAITTVLTGSARGDGESGKVTAPLKDGVPFVFVVHKGRSIKIERDLYSSFQLDPGLRSSLLISSASCPPNCLQPMQLDVPVDTIGEVEVVDFMLTTLRDNKGVLVDVRSQREYDHGTIPGSEHHVITKFQRIEEMEKMMAGFGATRRGEVDTVTRLLEDWGITDSSELTPEWDFSRVKELIIWSDGPTSELAPDAIRALVAAGYPPHKLHWYRGGIANWQFWGFNTIRKPKKY